MPRGRIGALSRSTFFPGTGDQLEDPREGVVWECARSNSFTDDGRTIKYGLLRGVSSSDGEVLYEPITSEEKAWLLGILTIRRRVDTEEGGFRVYDWAPETGTWRQRKD
jgi:hypothetical protein